MLEGARGNDRLDGGAGADILKGGLGNDVYIVDTAADQVIEGVGQGTDTIVSTVSYALRAGQSVETLQFASPTAATALNLTGNEFANTLIGNAGANTLNGGAGADILKGGLGNDIYKVDTAADQVIEAVGQGTDTLISTVSYALRAGQAVETLQFASPTAATALNLTGNELANTLIGNAGANVLNGLGGADRMLGGAGSDTYYVDNAGDTTIDANGTVGTDLVFASVSYGLGGSELENLTLTGTGNLNGTGNSIANVITGNSGSNVLNGLGGVDGMQGFGGNDVYYVDNAGDRVREATNEGTDTVRASVSYALAAEQEVEVLRTTSDTGGGAFSLTGNYLSQTIRGNAGNNVINGRSGNDTLAGLGGSDTFAFSTALGATNIDQVTDFSHAADMIQLARAVFTALAAGPLTAGAFHDLGVAGAQLETDDRILYDRRTGALSYDADGANGDGGADIVAVRFAVLTTRPTDLNHTDFLIV